MQLRSLLPAALACAASVGAFLLPPDMSDEALEAFNAVSPDNDQHWVASLASEDTKTDLVLDFSQTDREILLNGVPFYPPSPIAQPLTVKQAKTPEDGEFTTQEMRDVPLTVRMDFAVPKELEHGLTIRPFRMEVLGVEDKVVRVDTITFDILEDPQGHIFISNPAVVPTETTPLDRMCTTIFCRIRAQIMAQVAAVKAKVGAFKAGCAQKMGFGAPARKGDSDTALDRIKGGPNKFKGTLGQKKPCPGRMRKHGHGNSHGHHRHGAFGKAMHFLVRFTRHVVMPVMIGVAAGMAVSALGMLVGQIIFMIWMRVRARRSGASYVAVYQAVESSEDPEQGRDEDLPKYEEKEDGLPAYVDEKRTTEH